ncbi:MAG: hypothetical protein AAFQ82_02570 [Myxococcota bacterium]
MLRWVIVRTLTLEDTTAICGSIRGSTQLPGPPSAVAAVTAWSNPKSWRRCQMAVEGGLARGHHLLFAANVQCPTRFELGAPDVREVWQLLQREFAHRHDH